MRVVNDLTGPSVGNASTRGFPIEIVDPPPYALTSSTSVVRLTVEQLRRACGDAIRLPHGLPDQIDSRTAQLHLERLNSVFTVKRMN